MRLVRFLLPRIQAPLPPPPPPLLLLLLLHYSSEMPLASSEVLLLLTAIVLGVIFARISRPSQRGRTIFLSDCAVIARRDGSLRFMFRCADIRPSHTVRASGGCPLSPYRLGAPFHLRSTVLLGRLH